MSEKSNTSQAVWIAVGNMFSTGIALVSAMILSRYFDKEDYGTYKQVIYIYSTMQIVFTLGLPRCFSYFLPRLPIEQAKYTIKKITNIFYITGAIFACILFVGSPFLADAFKNDKLVDAIRIYSPVAFFLLPTLGLEGILATFRKSEYIAIYNTLTRVFMLVCIVLPVIIFHGSYKMALWGFVASSFITYLLALYLQYKPLKGIQHKRTSISYKDIWKFSLPLVTASIWGALMNSTDQFFISRYFGTEVFASFSNGAMQLPFVGMITAATITVTTPLFSRYIGEGNNKEAIDLWSRSTIKCSLILIPLIVFFISFAKPLMIAMYGEQYSDSAIFFQIKQMASFAQVVTAGTFIFAIGATKFYSNLHMYAMIVLLPLEYFAALYCHSAYWVTAIHVVVTLAMALAVFIFVAKRLRTNIIDFIPIKNLSRILIISLGVTLITCLVCHLMRIENNLMILIVGSLIFCLAYFALDYYFKLGYKEIIISLLPAFIKQRIKL